MLKISVSGKVAIVTGGASGIGKAIALKLAEAGADVAVSDINLDEANKVVEEITALGRRSLAIRTDVSSSSEVSLLTETVISELGDPSILVNSAGVGMMKPVLEFQDDEIDKIINVNLKGTIYASREVLKRMIPNKDGKIINISSIGAKNAMKGTSIYGATKSGVMAFGKVLAREVAQDNINVNTICPGIIRTPMWEGQLECYTHNEEEKNQLFDSIVEKEIPMNRPQTSEDIANLVVYLCSEEGKNITAQDINVDGGSLVH